MFRFALPALVLTIMPVAAEQLTIRCDVNGGPTLLTFDTASGQMKSEAVGGSRSTEEGRIIGLSDKGIDFVFPDRKRTDQGQSRFHYMREEGRIYSHDDFERLVAAERCVPLPLRDLGSETHKDR
jgi:hypothetical protein